MIASDGPTEPRAHSFSWRGVAVEYYELPDADTDLLFGNVAWPCATDLSRLLIDADSQQLCLWTEAESMKMGVPLFMLVQMRYGVQLDPRALQQLGSAALGLPAGEPVVPSMRGRRVLEVGAGVGLVGLVCHACGASVTMTDAEQRLVDELKARHGHLEPPLHFGALDWTEVVEGAEQFDVVIGSDLFNPKCQGEVFAPRVVSRRLSKAQGARALFICEVRRVDTCQTAVRELQRLGLSVATFQVCEGRELFEVSPEVLPAVGSTLLLVATWGR